MDFQKFLLENKDKIKKIASENGKYDSKGRVVISKDDEWRTEDENNIWDKSLPKAVFKYKIGDLHEEDLELIETKFMEYILNN